ncbi:Ltp family lipoprotein [Demequina sp. NBRC 110055]|uniref:Ltp family lipoprotein n=1 Tax=Demequina sp. NBRC 110055 TaxID=1570344 RepID=UPI00135651CB|nr:Ltp family lipoprotein [Demequina sp. NBRC 110055]
MSTNAPAGWYPQEDGTQRYWDGAQWTEHIAPGVGAATAASTDSDPQVVGAANAGPQAEGEVPVSPPADEREWWKKKRFLIPIGAVAVFFGIGALGAAAGGDDDSTGVAAASPTPTEAAPSPTETPDVSSPTPTASEAPTTFMMPDLVGDNLQDAQDELQDLGSYFVDQEDASGDERTQVLDSNWQVCTQDPAAGDEVPIETVVVLASVTLDETCPGEEPEATDEPAEVEAAPAEESTSEDEGDTEEPATSSASASQVQAVRQAESYLDYTAFSRDGLVDQLEYEGFSHDDAIYGADNAGADWNEQAVLSAESYLDYTAFSKSGLIDQLEYEGFTKKQAEHGVAGITVDWNEQAALSAESYLDYQAFSRSGLIDQLTYEGFTSEQATYGVDQAGL